MVTYKKGTLLTLIGLYVLTIPFFNALNVTTYDSTQILGHFGDSTTVFTYASYIPVFVMLAFLPLALKVSKQIPMRTMILMVSFLGILFNTFSLYATTIQWFTFWRSLLAIVAITGIFASMVPILLKYNPAFNMALMYGIFQFIQKGSQQLYQYFGAQFTSFYNWTFAVYFLNANFFMCIILAWIFYRADAAPMKTKFSFDWRGWLIMILFFTVILFLCTEGQTRNWFSDLKVNIAIAFLAVLTGIYLLHVRFTDDPLINPDVYKHTNVIIGVFLFFYIGAINGTGSIVTGFMGNILGFDSIYEARTHLSIFIGLCISIPLSTYLLYKKIFLSTIWVLGFACYGMYHIILFFRFYPEIEPADFFMPLLFKGLGMGFLFPVSLLYISEGIPKHLSTSRMMSGVISQTVLALLLGGAVLSTILSNTNIQHKTGLSQQLSALNQQASQQLTQTRNYYLHMGQSPAEAQKNAEKSLSNATSRDAMLLAYKDIYLVMAAVSFLPVFFILIFRLGQRPLGRVSVEPIPV